MIKCDNCNAEIDVTGVPSLNFTQDEEDYNLSIASEADGELQSVTGKDLCGECTCKWFAELLALSVSR